jgi:hypothetical protein
MREGDLTAERSPPPEEFRNDDAGYLWWLAGHRGGFVLDVWWPAASDVPKLHRATCGWISGTPPRGTWTAGGNYKVVAGSVEVLLRWAYLNARRPVERCSRCEP